MPEHNHLMEKLRTIESADRASSLLLQCVRSMLVLYTDLLATRSDEFCVPPLVPKIDFEKAAIMGVKRAAVVAEPAATLLMVLPWVAPEAFFPFGFDAVRFATESLTTQRLSQDFAGAEEEMLAEFSGLAKDTQLLLNQRFRVHAETCVHCRRRLGQVLLTGPQYRSTSGAWATLTSLMDRVIPLADSGVTLPDPEWIKLTFTNIIEKYEAVAPDENRAIIALPALWRPDAEAVEPQTTGIPDLLSAIRGERVALHEIPWRRLEELVAELLRARGMKVHVTPRSGDGGRDIIARGELIPGEPSMLAVEVKQKPVVGVQDLRAALWANRQFPALLFATSGRFTAGVLREKRREDNSFRLILKDGVSLAQWINSYIDSRAGSKLKSH